ncbi:hypothetical protein SUGI_0329050 [Cryptomeria japonica]|nr:hypothetical protein SUGI_0329050 [Cryptomeria japonica]
MAAKRNKIHIHPSQQQQKTVIIRYIDSVFIETDTAHFKSVVQCLTGQKCSDCIIPQVDSSSLPKDENVLALEPPVKQAEDEHNELGYFDFEAPSLAEGEMELSNGASSIQLLRQDMMFDFSSAEWVCSMMEFSMGFFRSKGI